MHVEECPEFKGLKSTAERVAFTHGWYAALDAESQKPTPNSKSMPLCDGCSKPFPELICYCEQCLDHVIRMGA
jgi:hypothetical protein